MEAVREYISTKIFLGVVLCLFGSGVNALNACIKARRNNEDFTRLDTFALFVSACFSGVVFGIVSLMLSSNSLHWYLAVATGAFMGLSGLNKLADRSLDVLLGILKK